MNNEKTISFISDRKHYDIPESSILYISMNKQDAFIHTSDGSVLKTRMTFAKIQHTLSANFIRITRGCLVSAMAIHSVGKLITLSNGESLEYCSLPRKTQKTDKQNTKNPPEKKLPGGFKTYLNGFIMPF